MAVAVSSERKCPRSRSGAVASRCSRSRCASSLSSSVEELFVVVNGLDEDSMYTVNR